MQTLCEQHSLTYQFVDAVYGKDLTENEIVQVYSKEKALHEFGRELTKGEIGCALSHLSIYREIVDKNIERAIIFEDDIVIQDGFLNLIESVNNFPKNWECILLGHYRFSFRKLETASSLWKRVQINQRYEIVRLMEHAFGAHGYLINKQGAIKLIEAMTVLSKPVDLYTGDKNVVNIYAISPPCITLEPSLSLDSNLHNDREENKSDYPKIVINDSALKAFFKKIRLFNLIKIVYEFVFSLPIIIRYRLIKFKQPNEYL